MVFSYEMAEMGIRTLCPSREGSLFPAEEKAPGVDRGGLQRCHPLSRDQRFEILLLRHTREGVCLVKVELYPVSVVVRISEEQFAWQPRRSELFEAACASN